MMSSLAQKITDLLTSILSKEDEEKVKPNSKFSIIVSPKILFYIFFSCFYIGFFISNIVSYFAVDIVIPKQKQMKMTQVAFVRKKYISMSLIQKNVTARNLFNQKGEIPFEDTPEGSQQSMMKNFENASCAPNEKLPVQLIGIIYTGNPKTTLITLKDDQVPIADVYKEGQSLIDNESYSVYKVTGPLNVQFRHDKKKICLSLNPQAFKGDGSSPGGAAGESSVNLQPAFVTEQLGPGFSKILNSARLVPQIVDGKTEGFKIFAISRDSLFDKVQLLNGDVIKGVNGINLEDPSQGFKIYEAFQDENNITLQLERNGETLTKKVTVQ